MSYSSSSCLRRSATLTQVKEVIELLGFKRLKSGFKIPNCVGEYVWYDETEYRSWSGVELGIYKSAKGPIRVETRSTASRSYWDLTQQNHTVRLLRDLFGGSFQTDGGKNRCWKPEGPPPKPLSSGCYLARWLYQNGMTRVRVYLMTRKLDGQIAQDKPSGFLDIDQMNPRLLSNNLLVPYMIAIWEEFFRASFSACLQFGGQREAALKRARLSHSQLEKLAGGTTNIERSVAETFAFQRPSAISEHFKLLDSKLDIAAALRKPYRGRKTNLFDSIEKLVGDRNALVHAGDINLGLFDTQLTRTASDLTEAVDRAYDYIGKHYGFTAIQDF